MSTEQETIEHDQAAFMAGYKGDPQPAPPAEEQAAPAPQGEAAAPADGPEVDEYAGLSPKVREQLQQLDSLRQAASMIPTLEHRLRSAEGRVAALQKSVPAPTPPAPPRLEKVERIREEWPDVVEAMEEMLQSKTHPKADEPPADLPMAQAQDEDLPTPLLDAEMPDWGPKLAGPQFQAWLASQGPDYQTKVKRADSEGVVLAALTKFDAHQDLARARAAAAAKAVDTRTARASAAVTPVTAGRREPATATLEDAFAQGFNTRR